MTAERLLLSLAIGLFLAGLTTVSIGSWPTLWLDTGEPLDEPQIRLVFWGLVWCTLALVLAWLRSQLR